MPRDFSRTLRVAEQVQRELADLIRLEIKDPRVGMVTLTDATDEQQVIEVMTGTVPFQLAKGAKTYLPLAETVSTPLPAIVTDSPAA